jgi:hypothetical protein
VTVPCAATSDTTVGGTCSITTTADTLTPGAIKEGARAIYDTGEMTLFDGGPDGVASTPGNTVFATDGFFIP